MQKGQTSSLILAGILVLVVIAGGAYYLGRQTILKPQSQNSVVTSESTLSPNPADETANWKTYTNNLTNYSIKYPNNWFELPDVGSSGCVKYFSNQNVEESPKLVDGIIRVNIGCAKVTQDEYNQAFKKYFDSNAGEIIDFGPSGGVTKVADLKIDREKAVKFITETSDDGVKYKYQIGYMVFKNNILYTIYLLSANRQLGQQYSDLFDQILSTFKFLE